MKMNETKTTEIINDDSIWCTCGNLLTGWEKYCSQCGINKVCLENVNSNSKSIDYYKLNTLDLGHLHYMIKYAKNKFKQAKEEYNINLKEFDETLNRFETIDKTFQEKIWDSNNKEVYINNGNFGGEL